MKGPYNRPNLSINGQQIGRNKIKSLLASKFATSFWPCF